MELTMPVRLKSIERPLARAPQRSVEAPVVCAAKPARRPLARLFRRKAPTAFHRCLAVHMYYARSASALD
jgi:hypothetical protein